MMQANFDIQPMVITNDDNDNSEKTDSDGNNNDNDRCKYNSPVCHQHHQ